MGISAQSHGLRYHHAPHYESKCCCSQIADWTISHMQNGLMHGMPSAHKLLLPAHEINVVRSVLARDVDSASRTCLPL
eukprot:2509556-Amphidinium_carterae.1